MIKKILMLALVLNLASCTELTNVMGTMLEEGGGLSNAEVGQGLKQALQLGIGAGADRLSLKDGYFKSAYKILLPEDVRKVTSKLQNVPGFSNVENVLLEKINRGAEDAAKKAKPIFVQAIKQMSFRDAMGILMGDKNAATSYLHGATYTNLKSEFSPVIVNSLNKFDALDYWKKAVTAYNRIPLVKKMNPELDDYITNQALKGLFSMVEKEERSIRTNVSARSTDLLKKVFAAQDK